MWACREARLLLVSPDHGVIGGRGACQVNGFDDGVAGQESALLGAPIHNLHVASLHQGSIRQPAPPSIILSHGGSVKSTGPKQ